MPVSYTHLDVYKRQVVSLLPNAKDHMLEHGMSPEKFIYIPNGIIREDWEKPMGNPPAYADKLGLYLSLIHI